MGRAGDGSTLTLDFTAMGGTLDPRITFSRADATALATFINSSGFVQTVATAQAPRFDFDPTTLVAKGLLLEGPATNLLNWSETFATTGGTNNNWADTNLTRTSTNNTSPRNDATALRITASAANGTIISSAAIGTSASRVLSVWLRRVTGTGNIQYTLDNGTSYTTQAITSSWVRYSFPATTAAQRVGFRIVTSADAIEIWGAQLETTASSSYIATGSGQVTRAVDTAIIAAGAAFNSWYTGGTSGTFVANWYGSASTPTARSVVATNDQTTKHLHMYQTASALTLRLADFPVTTVTTANSLTAGALTKGAFSYAASATSLCLNGGTVATGTLAFSAAPTWLSIGGPSTNGTSITDTTVMLNNSIRTIKYFPTRLTDGQIQGLTDLNLGTYTADVLVVAGGGGGGGLNGSNVGGGGGAGGLLASSLTFTPSTSYTVVVGAGGAGSNAGNGVNGSNSSLPTLTAIGGGGGGQPYAFVVPSGGSGGGAGAQNSTFNGGSGTSGQGNAGGNSGSWNNGGGGGGAGAVGSNSVSGAAGNGGSGSASTISGGSLIYAVGGGGSCFSSGDTNGSGSANGDGAGADGYNASATSGTANRGNGGGGGGANAGGNGGSGIVVISYAGAQRGSGGTVSSSGGNTIHTFTSTGTFTYTG